nr:thioredoxin family protein [candidate division Zixibacteria bacterium]
MKPGRLLKFFLITLFLLLAAQSILWAQTPRTLKMARFMAHKENKLILMEFYREDCEYCEKANQEAGQNPQMKQTLAKVMHLPLDVLRDEGGELARQYNVGTTYPVFILVNIDGDVISRWIGYNGPHRFITTLNKALADPITINQRAARFEKNPDYAEALYLAGYNSEIGEYLKAVDYYRRAGQLGEKKKDFSFDIFKNYANAAWKDSIPFDQVLPSADSVLVSGNISGNDKIMAIKILGRLARDKNTTDWLIPYLQKGLDLTRATQTEESIAAYDLFRGDQALYARHDTAGAIVIQQTSLGPDWQKDPEKYFAFARWCLERKIHLDEAETYARQALQRATGDRFRAMIMATIGQICEARGNSDQAEAMYKAAVETDPTTRYFKTLLENIQEE